MAQQQVSNSLLEKDLLSPLQFLKILFLINVSFKIYINISEFEFLRFHIYTI